MGYYKPPQSRKTNHQLNLADDMFNDNKNVLLVTTEKTAMRHQYRERIEDRWNDVNVLSPEAQKSMTAGDVYAALLDPSQKNLFVVPHHDRHLGAFHKRIGLKIKNIASDYGGLVGDKPIKLMSAIIDEGDIPNLDFDQRYKQTPYRDDFLNDILKSCDIAAFYSATCMPFIYRKNSLLVRNLPITESYTGIADFAHNPIMEQDIRALDAGHLRGSVDAVFARILQNGYENNSMLVTTHHVTDVHKAQAEIISEQYPDITTVIIDSDNHYETRLARTGEIIQFDPKQSIDRIEQQLQLGYGQKNICFISGHIASRGVTFKHLRDHICATSSTTDGSNMIQKMRLCATNKDKSRPCTLHSTTSLYKEVQEQQSLIERSVAAIEKHSTDKCAQRKALKSIFTTIKHNPVAPQKLNNNTYKSISQKDVKSIAIAKKDLPKNAMIVTNRVVGNKIDPHYKEYIKDGAGKLHFATSTPVQTLHKKQQKSTAAVKRLINRIQPTAKIIALHTNDANIDKFWGMWTDAKSKPLSAVSVNKNQRVVLISKMYSAHDLKTTYYKKRFFAHDRQENYFREIYVDKLKVLTKDV